ncbi:MAG: hypothetical protein AB7W47_00550 [Calditrichaceae bacterium]
MKNSILKSFVAAIILLSFSFSEAQVNLNIRLLDTDVYKTVYLSDLDLMQTGKGKRLFEVDIINSGPAIPNSRMEIRITRDSDPLFLAKSRDFTIPAGGPYSTDNIVLINNQFDFNGQSPVRFYESGVKEAGNDLQRDLLSSGRLPVGNYNLRIDIFTPTGNFHDDKIFFSITNPSLVQLVTPGNLIGYGSPEEIYMEFPLFQWIGTSGDYQVLVFEKRRGLQTIDDILNMTPSWASERISSLSVQYPAIGALPLEFGKTYYWLVRSFIPTSAGEDALFSEVWQFKLMDPSNMSNMQDFLIKGDIEELLADFVGAEKADEISKSLLEYYLKSVRINGQEITSQELYELINKYKGQKVEILDLILQSSN